MTKYEIILYWSNEDEAFIAEVPELAGCAADGATRQEALANAEIVMRNGSKQRVSLDARFRSPRDVCSSLESPGPIRLRY
jgi:predicted RNase H-like HicB family nuclease